MAQAGHSDPKVTLSIYASVIASKTDHGAALDEIVASGMGTKRHWTPEEPISDVSEGEGHASEDPADTGLSGEAADGIRTHDLLHGKQTL